VILFVSSFIVSLAISVLMTSWVQTAARARGLLVPPASERHLHTKPLPRIGGVGIYLSFLITVIAFCAVPKWGQRPFNPHLLIAFLVATCAIFLVGVYDDLRSLRPQSKLIFEIAAASSLYLSGFGLHNLHISVAGFVLAKPLGFIFTVAWILLITNAFNLIDGLDGLAVGTALLSSIVVLAISLVRHNDLVTMLTCAFCGTLLGFVPFNFHPASIFMGDSGSLFIGFTLGALSLSGWNGRPTIMGVVVPVLCFGLPILDVTLAIVRRFLNRQPLFHADADHVHHKLLKRGLTQQHAVLLLYGVTSVFVLASILLIRTSGILFPVLVITAIGICLGVQQLRYDEFSGGWLGLRTYLRRRQIARGQKSIQRASYSLEKCKDFRSICQVLKETLQPMGVDGIRLTFPAADTVPLGSVKPFSRDCKGSLRFSWYRRRNSSIAWQHCLHLPSSRQNSFEASVFRMRPAKQSNPDVEIFSDEFKATLANAIGRATRRIDTVLPEKSPNPRNLAADSVADSV
jgi:UDP-GlcNAc:undecaprenyl-phosphate GlcNAc-1-phosphate transferase